MTPALRRFAGRVAFWCVNATIALLVFVALVEPVAAWFAARHDEIEQNGALLARYERALSGPQAADAAPPLPPDLFVAGATDAVRSAALQEAVKRVAAASGVRILSVSALPAARDRPGVVALRVDMAGPLKSVSQAIARLKSGPPALAIARTVMRASATREETAGELTPLDVQLDIVGFAAR